MSGLEERIDAVRVVSVGFRRAGRCGKSCECRV